MDEEIRNAKITGLQWDNERCLTHYINLEGDGWGISFGGYCLKGEACCDWVIEIMKALDIYSFSDKELIGKIVRVKLGGWGQKATAIGHPIKDLWFNPEEVFKKYQKE